MRRVEDQPSLARELADRGFERLLSQHSKDRYYDGLMEAYALAAKRGHGGSTPSSPRSLSTSGR